jgi:lipoyl-dependent peroxiredoxin subunit C
MLQIGEKFPNFKLTAAV